MGIVCELYRISDSEIEKLTKLKPEIAEEFLDENYSWVEGKLHSIDNTVFSMSKGWDITKFLLKKADFSTYKILTELDGKYIKSDKAKEVNKVLNKITIEQLMDLYDQIELIENDVYRAEVEKNKEYIEYHLNYYKSAFKKASELNDGIVIHYC